MSCVVPCKTGREARQLSTEPLVLCLMMASALLELEELGCRLGEGKRKAFVVSKSARNRRKKLSHRKRRVKPADPHVEVVFDTIDSVLDLFLDIAVAADPRAEAEARIDDAAKKLVEPFVGYEPLGTLEAIRMMTLPFAQAGFHPPAETQNGLAVCEVLTIALLGASAQLDGTTVARRVDQELCGIVSERLIPLADELLKLATVRDILIADKFDEMTQVAGAVRDSGRWVRNTSYPEMKEETVKGLFGVAAVDKGVKSLIGFGVEDALSFLNACNLMQMEKFDARCHRLVEDFDSIDLIPAEVSTDKASLGAFDGLAGLFNPTGAQAAVPIADVAAKAGLSKEAGSKVAGFFAASASLGEEVREVRTYLDGSSPLRTRPLLVRDGLVMLIHPALITDSVESSFEGALKGSAYWETYAAHRGKYLEARVADLFKTVLPGVVEYHDVEYFVPADDSETRDDPPSYTKVVEGDHLFVLDDVAFIVEDKAIPLSDRSRTGELSPLRRNLATAIKKGAEQAVRMKQRVIDDHGLRLRDGSWIDLADVREVHTVVTSLDDMPGIATATAKLVGAGLLSPEDIPWTVSLNDLDLIVQLVDRPAEFLLYVRRRTEPKATEMFMAVDELDLFLLFFQTGLYVEPDPEAVAREIPWIRGFQNGAARRFRRQGPGLVTSQTDALDTWYYSLHPPVGSEAVDAAPKPHMASSPLNPLIDWLRDNDIFGWLSIGATLLEGSSDAQQRLAAYPDYLLSNPARNGQPRSIAVPWGLTKESGWLLVWMTRPGSKDSEWVLNQAHAYLVAKKEQLGYRRGASFVFDERSGSIIGASYDSGQTVVRPEVLSELVALLRPLGDMDSQAHLTQRRRATQRAAKRKRKHH